MFRFYPKFVMGLFVLLVGAAVKPLNSPTGTNPLEPLGGGSTCVLGAFLFPRSHQKGSRSTEQSAPGIPPALAGDLVGAFAYLVSTLLSV